MISSRIPDCECPSNFVTKYLLMNNDSLLFKQSSLNVCSIFPKVQSIEQMNDQ